MDEVWRDVVGYEGRYEVSNIGRVRSWIDTHGNRRKQPKILKQRIDRYGYATVTLWNGKFKLTTVHRLVAQAFIPNDDNLPQINHKDEVKTNNCVDNLEWCDARYNNNYGTRLERFGLKRRKPIKQFTKDGRIVAIYDSQVEAVKYTGIRQGDISDVLTGRQKSCKGFVWRYVNE